MGVRGTGGLHVGAQGGKMTSGAAAGSVGEGDGGEQAPGRSVATRWDRTTALRQRTTPPEPPTDQAEHPSIPPTPTPLASQIPSPAPPPPPPSPPHAAARAVAAGGDGPSRSPDPTQARARPLEPGGAVD